MAAHRALAAIDPSDRGTAYFALRASLCSRRDDLAAFDAAFAEWFSAPPPDLPEAPPALDEVASLVLPRVAMPAPERRHAAVPEEIEILPAAWSDVELLKEKDFAEYRRPSAASRARSCAGSPAPGPGGRVAARGRPGVAARRRTPRGRTCGGRCAASLRSGGEPFERHWREPAERPRPLVLVCDVSGSMEPYARMLLQYMQACVAARRRVEAFVFGTRLTRVTAELSGRDPDRALDRAASAADDWSGGTRIGEALATLNREHGRRLGRGAIVVLLSDGWDRGDPEQLAAEMAPARPLRTLADLAQPAEGASRLRAADRRHAGGAAVRGPFSGRELTSVVGGVGRVDGKWHEMSSLGERCCKEGKGTREGCAR